MEFREREMRWERREEEFEGEKRGGKWRERKQGFRGGENVFDVVGGGGGVVKEEEEWVQIYEKNDAVCVGVTYHWI